MQCSLGRSSSQFYQTFKSSQVTFIYIALLDRTWVGQAHPLANKELSRWYSHTCFYICFHIISLFFSPMYCYVFTTNNFHSFDLRELNNFFPIDLYYRYMFFFFLLFQIWHNNISWITLTLYKHISL